MVALDGRTGELMWSHSLREGKRAGVSPRQFSGRGLSYWAGGRGDDCVIYVTTGYRLAALNAHNGAPVSGFGKDGIVDLKDGVVFGAGQQIDLETGEIGWHATPAIARDVVIVGSSFREGATVGTHNNTKGPVRAFDVGSGKLLWTFHTIPLSGEVRQRHPAEGFVGRQRQQRRVDADHDRRRARSRLPAGRDADVGLLRRSSPGRQPVCRKPGVGAVWMAAPQSGSPMTYLVDGKQYIMVAISGGNYSAGYVAFTLPPR